MRFVRTKLFLVAVLLFGALLAGLSGVTSASITVLNDKVVYGDIVATDQYTHYLSEKYRERKKKEAEEAKVKAELAAYREKIAPDIAPFPKGALATLIRRIDTKKPVVFLTMDDGLVKNTNALAYIKEHKLNPTLFLTDQIIKDNYAYFKDYQNAGIMIENHTLTHPTLTKLGYTGQKAEICGQSDKISSVYGTRPTIMRPPYGEFNTTTLSAAHDCGVDFVVHWSAKVDGGAVQYQRGNHLVAGDVVLMHFRPLIMEDLKAFYDEVTSQGLTPAYLSDWLK